MTFQSLRVAAAVVVLLGTMTMSSSAQVRRPKPVAPARTGSAEEKRVDAAAAEARENLISKTKVYRESLDELLKLQKGEQVRIAGLVEARRALVETGIISRRELEESQAQLDTAAAKITETTKSIEEADQLVTEVMAAEQFAKIKPEPPGTLSSGLVLIRYSGTSNFSLNDHSRIDEYFHGQFARSMPVSAFGQSATHERMGFDHRSALDVAIHPDSVEGRSLMAYLRSQGIPFLAFRAAVSGSATGAHVHIGPPSSRASGR